MQLVPLSYFHFNPTWDGGMAKSTSSCVRYIFPLLEGCHMVASLLLGYQDIKHCNGKLTKCRNGIVPTQRMMTTKR